MPKIRDASQFIISKEWYWRVYYHTSLVGTFKIFDADKKISGAGFKFSKASADTIASNLMQRG